MPRTLLITICIILALGALVGGGWLVLRPQTAVSPYADWKPVPEVQLRSVAEAIANALAARDGAAIDRLLDGKLLAQHAFSSLVMTPMTRRGLEKGALNSLATASLGTQIVSQLQAGVTARVISLRSDHGRQVAVLRLNHTGGTNYFKLRVGTPPDGGRAKLMDIYLMTSGSWMSENISNISGQLLDGSRASGEANAHRLTDIRAALARKDGMGAERIFRQLPAGVRQSKMGAQLLLTIIPQVPETDQHRLLAEIATTHGADPSMALILIDHHFNLGDHAAVLADLDQIAAEVGDDGWLCALRASMLSHAGPDGWTKAIAQLERAHELEPDNAFAWEVQVDASLAHKDFARTLAALRILERQFGRQFELAGVAEFAGFCASPFHRSWLADHPSKTP